MGLHVRDSGPQYGDAYVTFILACISDTDMAGWRGVWIVQTTGVLQCTECKQQECAEESVERCIRYTSDAAHGDESEEAKRSPLYRLHESENIRGSDRA